MIQSFIEGLEKRHAAKRFDTDKSLSEKQRAQLQEAIRLSPSSYGLQPYKIGLITSKEVKKTLYAHSFAQAQVLECDTLFVFCSYTQLPENYIQNYIDLIARERSQTRDTLKELEQNMQQTFTAMSSDAFNTWAKCQAYIALGVLVGACAMLGAAICPMEGFEADQYNRLLGLEKHHLTASVIAAVGYHSPSDPVKDCKKVRLHKDALFFTR